MFPFLIITVINDQTANYRFLSHNIQPSALLSKSRDTDFFCRTSGFHTGGYKKFLSRALLANFFMLVSSFPYSSTLKIEVTCSSETLADFRQTTRRYVPEDIALHILFLFVHC
jgi:hypothetical protein